MPAQIAPTSLRRSLFRLVLVPTGMLLLLLFAIIWLSVQLIFNDVKKEQTLVVETSARLSWQYLEETRILLGNIGSVILELKPADRDHLLAHTHRNYPRFTSLFILDGNGIVLNEQSRLGQGSLIGFDLSGEPYFQEVQRSHQPYFSDTFFSISANDIAVTVAQPILSGDKLMGVLVGELSLLNLQRTIDALSFHQADTVLILDERATVIVHPDRNLVLQQVNLGYLPIVRAASTQLAIDILLMDANWSIVSAMPMQNGWLVVTSRPLREAARPLIMLIGASLLAFLVSVVILTRGVQRSVWRIGNPIAQLVQKTEDISKGHYVPLDADVISGRYVELNTLGESFNRMVVTVEARTSELLAANARLQIELEERQRVETALRHSEERYRSLFENAPISIWEEDFSEAKQYLDILKAQYGDDWARCQAEQPQLLAECARRVQVVSVNMTTLLMHGVQSQQALQVKLAQLFSDGVPATFARELETIWYDRADIEIEGRIKTLQGEIRYVIFQWSVMPECRESYERVLISMVDITALKIAEMELKRHREHLEELVHARTAELERANQELESFAYTVSHDLRTPLRHIDAYSSLLLMDYVGQLDEQGRNFLGNVRQGAQNMSRMVDGLLQLSRASRGELHYSQIDLSVLVEEIARELETTEPHRQVEWHITPQCLARGDSRLLRAAMQNLLNNAWKFSQRCLPARIEFGCLPDSEAQARYKLTQPVFFVRDNGAGFDMKYAGKLFTPFQRLHSEEQFAGTGIGLATVQRIIRRHGGDIWAEAGVGQGATFYFTLS